MRTTRVEIPWTLERDTVDKPHQYTVTVETDAGPKVAGTLYQHIEGDRWGWEARLAEPVANREVAPGPEDRTVEGLGWRSRWAAGAAVVREAVRRWMEPQAVR